MGLIEEGLQHLFGGSQEKKTSYNPENLKFFEGAGKAMFSQNQKAALALLQDPENFLGEYTRHTKIGALREAVSQIRQLPNSEEELKNLQKLVGDQFNISAMIETS